MAGKSEPVENLHVITENGEQCFMWRSNQLTYIAQDRQELPHILGVKFGPLATKLDLSYNSLTSFRHINLFTNLNELILDNNSLEDAHMVFKPNLRLKTLSLNKNKLTDLYRLINGIKVNFPNLEFLSLIGNPLCPGINLSDQEAASRELDSSPMTTIIVSNQGSACINESNVTESPGLSYSKYRHFIIYHLPNLRFLDSTPISGSERDSALKRCYWMNKGKVPMAGGNGIGRDQHEAVRVTTFQEERDNAANREQSANQFQLTIMSNYDADGSNHSNDRQPKGAFSRLAYKYTGKNSEGNRFIRNQDL